MARRLLLGTLVLLCAATVAATAVVGVAMTGVSPELSGRVDGFVSLGLEPEFAPPPPASGPGGRLVIPKAQVDAPIITVGRDANGAMLTPSTAWEVGWYDFSALPGEPSNVVMAAHVTFRGIGPAVFYHLKDLRAGDEIEVHLTGGAVVRYRVSEVQSYELAAAPVEAIVGPTDGSVFTLITCDGGFDPAAGVYDHRLVVRAVAEEA